MGEWLKSLKDSDRLEGQFDFWSAICQLLCVKGAREGRGVECLFFPLILAQMYLYSHSHIDGQILCLFSKSSKP